MHETYIRSGDKMLIALERERDRLWYNTMLNKANREGLAQGLSEGEIRGEIRGEIKGKLQSLLMIIKEKYGVKECDWLHTYSLSQIEQCTLLALQFDNFQEFKEASQELNNIF